MPSLKGECLCGSVKYSIQGEIGTILHCHCSECRKWHGSAFRSRAAVQKKFFQWDEGEELVSRYDGLPTSIKTFCKVCGSNLISYFRDNDDVIGLPLGGIEGDLETRPVCHIFVDSKANWYEITDNLPQFSEFPDFPSNIHQ